MKIARLVAFFAFVFLASIPLMGQYNLKPCDSSVTYVNHNMIDYTIKVRALRGKIIDSFGNPILRGCVALFSADHAKLVRTIEANENGEFEMKHVKAGDYWLIVQDRQRAFCPAAARVKLRKVSRKGRIAVHMQVRGIDRCSYAEAK